MRRMPDVPIPETPIPEPIPDVPIPEAPDIQPFEEEEETVEPPPIPEPIPEVPVPEKVQPPPPAPREKKSKDKPTIITYGHAGHAGAAGASSAGGGSSSSSSVAKENDIWFKKALIDLLKTQKQGSAPKGKKQPNALKQSKKIYNDAKKRIRKQIRAKRKEESKAARARIKQLPAKQRTTARKQFNAAQKAKYDTLTKSMPTTKGLTHPQVRTLMQRMKSMRI